MAPEYIFSPEIDIPRRCRQCPVMNECVHLAKELIPRERTFKPPRAYLELSSLKLNCFVYTNSDGHTSATISGEGDYVPLDVEGRIIGNPIRRPIFETRGPTPKKCPRKGRS